MRTIIRPALAKSFVDHAIKVKHGTRIWEKTPTGFISRMSTPEDAERLRNTARELVGLEKGEG